MKLTYRPTLISGCLYAPEYFSFSVESFSMKKFKSLSEVAIPHREEVRIHLFLWRNRILHTGFGLGAGYWEALRSISSDIVVGPNLFFFDHTKKIDAAEI